jgi:predicted Zn-dependent peptidase
MGRMQALGMAWTYLGSYRSVDDELKSFQAVTRKKIRQVLDQYPLHETTTFALGPLEKLRRPKPNGRR